MTDERDKLDRAVYDLSWAEPKNLNEEIHDAYKAAADAYAAAERLDEHVKTCETLGGNLTRTDIGWDSQRCGDDTNTKPIWYCDRAPIKESVS